MRFIRLACATAAGCVSAVLLSAAAAAQSTELVVEQQRVIDPEIQRVVPYRDLNLATQQGERKLLRRVSYAVNSICETHLRGVQIYAAEKGCRTSAWNSANPQIERAIAQHRAGNFTPIAIRIVVASE